MWKPNRLRSRCVDCKSPNTEYLAFPSCPCLLHGVLRPHERHEAHAIDIWIVSKSMFRKRKQIKRKNKKRHITRVNQSWKRTIRMNIFVYGKQLTSRDPNIWRIYRDFIFDDWMNCLAKDRRSWDGYSDFLNMTVLYRTRYLDIHETDIVNLAPYDHFGKTNYQDVVCSSFDEAR